MKSQDIVKAEAELTGVRKAAIAAGHRMAIHTRTLLSCTARFVSTKQDGVHALIVDDHAVAIEISGGDAPGL